MKVKDKPGNPYCPGETLQIPPGITLTKRSEGASCCRASHRCPCTIALAYPSGPEAQRNCASCPSLLMKNDFGMNSGSSKYTLLSAHITEQSGTPIPG